MQEPFWLSRGLLRCQLFTPPLNQRWDLHFVDSNHQDISRHIQFIFSQTRCWTAWASCHALLSELLDEGVATDSRSSSSPSAGQQLRLSPCLGSRSSSSPSAGQQLRLSPCLGSRFRHIRTLALLKRPALCFFESYSSVCCKRMCVELCHENLCAKNAEISCIETLLCKSTIRYKH